MPLLTFYQLMSWLASAVGITAWMAAWSNILSSLRNPGTKPLDSPLKEVSEWLISLNSWKLFWVNLLGAVLVPLLAAILLQFVPASVFEALEPYWTTVAMIAFAFWQQQRQHASRPKIEPEKAVTIGNITIATDKG